MLTATTSHMKKGVERIPEKSRMSNISQTMENVEHNNDPLSQPSRD
jgi:hypothetical protein